MARDFLHAIDDMLNAILGVERSTLGKTFDDYRNDWLLRHAVQRAIEIISEASRSIPDEVKHLRSDIPWPRIAAIGNVLRHEYHAISDRLIWNVIVDELPHLKAAILTIKDSFDR